MSQQVLADTGPLFAAVDPDDQYHQRAQQDLTRLGRDGWEIAVVSPILLECYTLVLRKLGVATAHDWLEDILAQAIVVNPVAADYLLAAQEVFRYRDQPLTLVDVTLAVVSQRTVLPVWTFDHHFDILRADVWR